MIPGTNDPETVMWISRRESITDALDRIGEQIVRELSWDWPNRACPEEMGEADGLGRWS